MKRIVILLALAVVASPVAAQTDSAAAPGWLEQAGATVTVRAGLWTSTRELDAEGPLGAAMLWGKVSRPIGEHVSVFAEGWTALRGPFDRGKARGEVREAFVTITSGPFELRAGRQIIAWGRADGINPTDNLTGQDLTLLAPDDSDRRRGAAAARLTYAHRDHSFTATWLPEFRGHRVPIPEIVGALKAPASEWRPAHFAARVEQTGRAVDWSVSAYNGRDLAPDFGVRGGGDTPRLTLTHNEVRVIGADAAGNLGRFGLRAEAAYVDTEDRDGIDPFIKNPFFSLVAGADRTMREHLNVNVQYLFRYVSKLDAPEAGEASIERLVAQQQAAFSGQVRRSQHGASARVSYKWLRDTLEAEIAAAGWARPRGAVIRPKASYAVSDRMKVVVGAELYRGDTTATFGLLRDNSGAFAELRWSF